jgi:HEAT repeat protein
MSSSYFSEQIERLHGPNQEDAYFNLIEAHPSVLPMLIEAYRSESDTQVRAVLVEIIWQHREPHTLGFLTEALQDPNDRVWKSALDGLVTLGGPGPTDVLDVAMARAEQEGINKKDFLSWVAEASVQIRNGLFSEGN